MAEDDSLALVPTSKLQLQPLLDATCASFQVIERWTGASAKHPSLEPFISRVQEQGVLYYEAVNSSIKTAQNGYKLSSDALFLCDHMLNPAYTTKELTSFIHDMQNLARKAHVAVVHQGHTFRRIRRELLMITREVPDEVAKLQVVEQSAVKRKVAALKRVSAAKFADTAVKLCAGLIAASSPSGVTAPALLVLPVMLPILFLITKKVQTRYTEEAEKRGEEAVSAVDAVGQLRQMAEEMVQLIDHVDLFASWWGTIDTLLTALEASIARLREDRLMELKVKSIKNDWGTIKEMNMEYMTKVNRLQDYYPPSVKDKIVEQKAITES